MHRYRYLAHRPINCSIDGGSRRGAASRVKGRRIPLDTRRLRQPVMLIARNPVSASLLSSDSPSMRAVLVVARLRVSPVSSPVPDFSRQDARFASSAPRIESRSDVCYRCQSPFLRFRRDENRARRESSRARRGYVPTFRFAYFLRKASRFHRVIVFDCTRRDPFLLTPRDTLGSYVTKFRLVGEDCSSYCIAVVDRSRLYFRR